MKRVLFMASQPFFERRGSPIRLGFDLLSLSQIGYKVDFITLPIGENRDIPNVNIVRAPNVFFARKISIGPSPMKLAFDFIIFLMALWRVVFRKYDVVHGVEDCGILALVAARIGGAKMVFERHSDPMSYSKGGKKPGFIVRTYAKVERFVMKHADSVICTGPGLAENAKRNGRAARVCCINDIPSSLADADGVETAAIRGNYMRTSDDILICYVGSFAVYQGINLLFSAIPLVAKAVPRARFIVIGGSKAEIAERKAELAAAGCENAVLFAGFVDPDKLPSHLAAMDILLSPRISGMNTPLKLLDYLKAKAAIVATDCEANRLILTPKIARLTPMTPEGFADGVIELCRDPARRASLAGQGQDLLRENHSFPVFRDGIRKCYEYILM